MFVESSGLCHELENVKTRGNYTVSKTFGSPFQVKIHASIEWAAAAAAITCFRNVIMCVCVILL